MNLQKQTYNNRIVLGTGICKKCGGDTCIKKRVEPSPKQLRKSYYFSKSETCTKCGAVWLKEEDKVYTKGLPKEVDTVQRLLNKIEELEKENNEMKAELSEMRESIYGY